MFYCNKCAEKNSWPITGLKSYGGCEICDKITNCNDIPSRLLPLPAPPKRKLISKDIELY